MEEINCILTEYSIEKEWNIEYWNEKLWNFGGVFYILAFYKFYNLTI